MKNIKSLFKVLILTPLTSLILASLAFTVLNFPSLKVIVPSVKDASVSNKFSKEEIQVYIYKSIASINTSVPGQLSKNLAFQVLSSTVRITAISSSTQTAMGTGVIIHSKKLNDTHNTYKSYIITNCHVVGNCAQVKVERFFYLREKFIGEVVSYMGNVRLRDEDLDLALINVESPREIGHASSLISNERLDQVSLYDAVFISGCALGSPPHITNGNIAFMDPNYYIVTAHATFGNSGGGMFTTEGKVLGIINKIGAVKLPDGRFVPEPNISRIIPSTVVMSWLHINGIWF